jgi:hypothetical protein
MFRKALFPVFCAATFAAAIPLHIGESWVWQVTNRDNLDLTYRSAVVVDSARIPAGNVWTLVARDSVLKMSDIRQDPGASKRAPELVAAIALLEVGTGAAPCG